MTSTAGTTDLAGTTGTAVTQGWRSALAVGLLVDAALCGLLLAVIGELIPPVLVFLLLFAGTGALVLKRTGRAPVIAAIVIAALFLLGNLPFIIEDLSHPDTLAGFVPIWLLLLTTLFVLLAAVLTLRRSNGSARMPSIGFAAVAVAGVVASVVASSAVSDDSREPSDVLVVAEEVEYPSEVRVASGGTVFVENRDMFRHTFVVEDHEVDQELPGSASRRVSIALEPGNYDFSCDVPGHESMKGRLIVE